VIASTAGKKKAFDLSPKHEQPGIVSGARGSRHQGQCRMDRRVELGFVFNARRH
jgi:hypothetical protein